VLVRCGREIDDKGRECPVFYDTDELSDEDYLEFCKAQKEIDEYRKSHNGSCRANLYAKRNKILMRATY